MSQNQQRGISSAANLARLGHAVATVLQRAVSGGLHGAAVAAAKAFLPEIIKAIFYIILFCVFIPFFLHLSVVHPNFQYPTVQNSTIQEMNAKAVYVGSLYDSFSELTRQEADTIIVRLSVGYDDVVVTEDFGNTDPYWFISISSVWHEQDLGRITEESVRELVRQNIEYTYWVETYYVDSDEDESDPRYRIYIDIYDIGPNALMQKLALDTFKTQWAGFLYQNQMGMLNDDYETSSNGTHSEIKDMIQGDDTPLEGGNFGNPFPGTNWTGNITSYFGSRPYPGVGTSTTNHTGLDISAVTGTEICAVQSGTVLFVRDSGSSGYGKHLAIHHGGGYVTLYAHCSQILVRQRQRVETGQAIAKVGQTGWATGPHLHIEVIVDGEPKGSARVSFYAIKNHGASQRNTAVLLGFTDRPATCDTLRDPLLVALVLP